MIQFETSMLHPAMITAAICVGLGVLGLAVGWPATRVSAVPEKNGHAASGAVRWATGNSLRLWWDLIRAPLVCFRLAVRRDRHRRRAHRRAS